MNAKSTTSTSAVKACRREELIALAREIRCEFAKIHAHMTEILREPVKKAA